MLDRHLLRYFLAVVDTGAFSRAATVCRVSQPTVSSGIARLEEVTGQVLFKRSNRRVELTAAGARLVPHARRIEAEFLEAQRSLADVPALRLVRIGVASTIAPRMIEAALQPLTQSSDLRLEVLERRPGELGALIDRGLIDLAIGPAESGHDHRQIPLFTEPYQLVLSAAHRLAEHTSLSCEQLVGEPMLVRRECEALPMVSRFFTARGIRPFMAARSTNEERIASYVRLGLGLTVMPRSLCREGMVARPLAGLELERTVMLTCDPASESRLTESKVIEQLVAALSA
ncbi:MAG: LysR family transcriptional regulator [Chakrabartia sp.]|jgi:DNA-binding transcriptional LysR family regulator